MKTFLYRAKSLFSIAFALLFLTACSSNPAGHDDDHDEYAEVEGIQILQGTAVLYQVLEGDVSCDSSPCGVSVAAGQTLSGLEVAWIDHDGDEVHSEDLDTEFTLGFSVVSPGTAVVEQNGRFGLNITGVVPGTTAMQVQLNHDGHADLTSPPASDASAIQITVTQ
jgi:hypothetical protein